MAILAGGLACVLLAAMSSIGYHKGTAKPHPKRDQSFIEAARKNTAFPWTTRPDGSNISQEARNEALAEAIEQGCKDLDRIKYLAKIAELDKPVTLESDKKNGTKSFFSTWISFLRSEQTPLARAQANKNPEIIQIIQEQAKKNQEIARIAKNNQKAIQIFQEGVKELKEDEEITRVDVTLIKHGIK